MNMVDLADKLASFDEPWVPKIVAELNGQLVKVAHFEGAYVWHSHELEDEFFLVLEGRVDLEFRDAVCSLEQGQCVVVPHGVEHRPVAHGRAQVLMFEPASTRNTGDLDHEYTIEPDDLQSI